MYLAKHYNAEVLIPSFHPYGRDSERILYGISADRIEQCFKQVFPKSEEHTTINGHKLADFLDALPQF